MLNAIPKVSKEVQKWLVLALLALTWGSSYILIKKGLVAFSPEQLASLRISISALAFLPFFLTRFNKIHWKRWGYLIVVGLSGSGIPAFLFAIAQTKLSSSLTGVLSSLTPLFTLAIGVLAFGVSFVSSKAIGVLLGLAGAISLIFFGDEGGISESIGCGILVILACACYALSSNTVKTYLQDMSAITISSVSFTIIGFPAVIYLFFTDFVEVLSYKEHAWASLGYVTILSIAGTVIASILFYRLVQMTDAVFASTVSYLIPIIALLWGIVDGELITIYHLLGMGLILFGVYISRK